MKVAWSECRVDTESRTLERNGMVVPIQPLAFDLLLLLLQHRGRVVSDAHLRRTLWPDVTVGDASLRQVVKQARRAIGDDGSAQAAIETVRGRGLRFVAPLSIERAGPAFVGREDVLAALERAMDETEAGRGGVTLLAGRSGIGKSSTLGEVAGRAAARGWRVIEAWARAGAESDAYALWTNVGREIGVAEPAAEHGVAATASGFSATSRFARFRAYEEALARSSRIRPILLCFDDLHDADRESLALLRFVAPALRSTRVHVLVGHRPVSTSDEHALDLLAIAADSATHAISLPGLAIGEVRALVAGRFGASLPFEATAALVGQTGGSPLLMLEVVRALHARGIAIDRASPEQVVESGALGIVQLVHRRLAGLTATTRRVLHVAAAIGDPFELALVTAASGLAPIEVEAALAEIARAALAEPHTALAWRFAHPLFAEAVVEDLGAQGREVDTEIRLRVFEALEATGEGDTFRIATHALLACARLAPAVVVDRLRRAARAARRMHAVADAESWQRRALEVAEAAALPPRELCELLLGLGELTAPSHGVLRARPHFDRAARIAREQGDTARLARAALGFAHRALVLDAQEPVLAWLRAAHAAPCGDPALEARVAARLGAEQVLANPIDRSAAELMLADGVERLRRIDDPLALANALADRSIAIFSAADPRGAIALAREVQSCGRHAGDAEIEFRGLAEIATLQVELGDRGGLDEAIAACKAFARRVPIPYAEGVALGMAAMEALLDGRLADASAAMGAADRYRSATGSLGFGVVSVLQRFLLARERGGIGELVPLLDQASARFSFVPGIGALAGLAHAQCGNETCARDAAERLLTNLRAVPMDRTRLATLAVGAELAHRTRCVPLARALEPLLLPFTALHAVVGNAACYFGSIAHALGLVAATDGRSLQAYDWFERARHAHEAMRAPSWSKRSAELAAAVHASDRRA